MRAECAEQRAEQRSAAAQANAPVEEVLKPIMCVGLNPYKMVEMFKNFRPVVPVEFHLDELYAEPSPEVWSKVKMEKTDRSESTRSTAMRATTAKRVRRRRVVFFSSRGISQIIIV